LCIDAWEWGREHRCRWSFFSFIFIYNTEEQEQHINAAEGGFNGPGEGAMQSESAAAAADAPQIPVVQIYSFTYSPPAAFSGANWIF
jgi:hypothetical protein